MANARVVMLDNQGRLAPSALDQTGLPFTMTEPKTGKTAAWRRSD